MPNIKRCPCDYNAIPTLTNVFMIVSLVKLCDGVHWMMIVFIVSMIIHFIFDHIKEIEKDA